MSFPRTARHVGLPFDVIEGRLQHLGAPAPLLDELRAEWDASPNEDRGAMADALAKSSDDELRASFLSARRQLARDAILGSDDDVDEEDDGEL